MMTPALEPSFNTSQSLQFLTNTAPATPTGLPGFSMENSILTGWSPSKLEAVLEGMLERQ